MFINDVQIEVMNTEFTKLFGSLNELKMNLTKDSDKEEIKRNCSDIEAYAYKVAAAARMLKQELDKDVVDQKEEVRKFWEESA